MAKWDITMKVCVVIDYDHEVWGVYTNAKDARKAVKKHIKDNYKDMTKKDIKFELEEYKFIEVLIE
jgi:hypothetical protein